MHRHPASEIRLLHLRINAARVESMLLFGLYRAQSRAVGGAPDQGRGYRAQNDRQNDLEHVSLPILRRKNLAPAVDRRLWGELRFSSGFAPLLIILQTSGS